MGRYEHIKTVENKMFRPYARLRSNLYKKGVDAHDAEEIARAKAVGRETMPKRYGPE